MASVVLLLGGNIGDTLLYFEKAKEFIRKSMGEISRSSSLYSSAAWGKTDQNDFINQVIVVETPMSPREVLGSIQEIELELGRVRDVKWGAREIDLDILFYDDLILKENDLIVPHPFIQDRKFTLIPLSEIMGSYKHPVTGTSINEILANCKDPLQVKRLDD